MADFQTPKLTRPNPTGPYDQAFTNASHTSDAATITNIAISSFVLTVTCTNSFTQGQVVSFTGLTGYTALNGRSVVVASVSGSQFTAIVTDGNYASTPDTGFVGTAGTIVLTGPGGKIDPSFL